MAKYRNKKVKYDGMVFDSVRELKRYKELKLLEKTGEIKELRTQVKYVLIPAQYETIERVGKKGQKLKPKKKLVEREVSYIADFAYCDTKNLVDVVEDTKGFKTKDYIIKRKLMLHVHGIKINEI